MTTPIRTSDTPLRALTVNEIVARHPQTVAVFNRFGIDSCCGGAVPLEEAARRDGVSVDELLAALGAALDAA